MKAIDFEGVNTYIAKDQPQYITLPARVSKTTNKTNPVTTCWKFNIKEKLMLLFGYKLILHTITFNQPFQPIRFDITRVKEKR